MARWAERTAVAKVYYAVVDAVSSQPQLGHFDFAKSLSHDALSLASRRARAPNSREKTNELSFLPSRSNLPLMCSFSGVSSCFVSLDGAEEEAFCSRFRARPVCVWPAIRPTLGPSFQPASQAQREILNRFVWRSGHC